MAVARALGDCSMKNFVPGTPFTSSYIIEDGDTHLILACDGVRIIFKFFSLFLIFFFFLLGLGCY